MAIGRKLSATFAQLSEVSKRLQRAIKSGPRDNPSLDPNKIFWKWSNLSIRATIR
jgi:hypothetical protein